MLSPTDFPAVSTHRWSRQEYEAMARGGVFHPEARLELIDGEILDMSPQSSRHAAVIRLIRQALRPAETRDREILIQLPLALGEDSEPEPDLALVEGGPRAHLDAHPANALLVVEVADTSLAFDRGPRQALYARSGIPEYWILNLESNRLEVFRRPQGEGYRDELALGAEEEVSPLAAPSLVIPVRELLP